VVAKYSGLPINDSEFKHKVLIININKTYQKGAISYYEATRKWWKLDRNKVKEKEVKYMISGYKRILRAIFEPKK
jgi:outer membrane phospholipase A